MTTKIHKRLAESGLKVTPQRVVILEALYQLNNHPTADHIIEYIRKNHPNIATGTVYKTLDTLVEKALIKRVKTDRDVMRYDGITEKHHHLYCSKCDLIEDYRDHELDKMLEEYFAKKNFKGFHMEDIVLQIRGTFDKC
ncbi:MULTISPECIES: Fur family transcriptional regulator [unclassified Saccharicrinis]|uniref:Fur family transcriptional regulator n=1 Tax=unclassified Saccharicrinis TaxID=2646859 RepID=UPI003D33D07F